MRAIVFGRNGGPEARDYKEVPDPEPSDGELLVDIEAARCTSSGLRSGPPRAPRARAHEDLEARKTTGKLILSA
jgi:hypothetical protein